MTLQLTGKVKPECPLLDIEGLQYGWGVEISPKELLTKCALEGREAFYIVPCENKHVPDMQLHLDIKCQKKKPFTGKCLLFSLSNDQVLRKGVKRSPWRLIVSVQPLIFKSLGSRTRTPLMWIFTSRLHMLSHLWVWEIQMYPPQLPLQAMDRNNQVKPESGQCQTKLGSKFSCNSATLWLQMA